MLDRSVFCREDDSFPCDDPTTARGTNSRGHAVRVCFRLHVPPRPSKIHMEWPAGIGDYDWAPQCHAPLDGLPHHHLWLHDAQLLPLPKRRLPPTIVVSAAPSRRHLCRPRG
uniref:Uncharacterized protein n=1 Tax=Oryza barthii TaxID=65489 RepID=A0A0D3HV68_9ORYZ